MNLRFFQHILIVNLVLNVKQGCLIKVFSRQVLYYAVLRRVADAHRPYAFYLSSTATLQKAQQAAVLYYFNTEVAMQCRSYGIPFLHTAGSPAALVFTADTILQARRGFQSQLSQILSAGSSFDAMSGAVVSAAALFEELLPGLAAANSPVGAVVGNGGGVGAAMALYQHAVDAVPVEVRELHV